MSYDTGKLRSTVPFGAPRPRVHEGQKRANASLVSFQKKYRNRGNNSGWRLNVGPWDEEDRRRAPVVPSHMPRLGAIIPVDTYFALSFAVIPSLSPWYSFHDSLLNVSSAFDYFQGLVYYLKFGFRCEWCELPVS